MVRQSPAGIAVADGLRASGEAAAALGFAFGAPGSGGLSVAQAAASAAAMAMLKADLGFIEAPIR